MMIVILAVGGVATAMAALALGVIFGKRTPLKGECHGFDPDRPAGSSCASCTCGSASLDGALIDNQPTEGEEAQ